ncbi:hypothetical protein BKA70DRAFT_1415813 [Coprinopsis sp. MPI-PUGE-AT-0042]|nr:hypothetical protein BKA70DRAFT_1415813 [Coprinopsis sp. MPI-PUGE-AT-0042]
MSSREEVDRFGAVLAKSIYSSVTISTLTVGIQLFMCFYSLSVFLHTSKERRKGRARFIVISFMIWIMFTFMTGLEASTDFETLYTSDGTGISYINRQAELWSNRLWWLGLHDLSLYSFIALGDGLMVWRCYLLWQHRKWRWLTPLPILDLTWFSRRLTPCSVTGICLTFVPVTNITSRRLIVTYIMLSVGTNIQVTAPHPVPLIQHSSVPRPDPPKDRTVADVLRYLSCPHRVCSAIGSVWACAAAMVITRIHAEAPIPIQARFVIADYTLSSVYYSFCALSPQLIIFRVTTGRTWKNARETRPKGALSQPIEFAHGVNTSSTGTAPLGSGPSQEQFKHHETP